MSCVTISTTVKWRVKQRWTYWKRKSWLFYWYQNWSYTTVIGSVRRQLCTSHKLKMCLLTPKLQKSNIELVLDVQHLGKSIFKSKNAWKGKCAFRISPAVLTYLAKTSTKASENKLRVAQRAMKKKFLELLSMTNDQCWAIHIARMTD